MMENSFTTDLKASTNLEKKINRQELRRLYGGQRGHRRSNAPRHIASRKILPMPENWQGWRNWKPKNKKVD